MWIAIGVLLGVLSRVEETVDGLFLAISTNTTWCAVAFLAGRPLRAVATMTAANAGYYAYVAIDRPGLELSAVAGSPLRWLALGVAAGLFFGRRRHWTALSALAVVAGSEVTGAGAAYLPRAMRRPARAGRRPAGGPAAATCRRPGAARGRARRAGPARW